MGFFDDLADAAKSVGNTLAKGTSDAGKQIGGAVSGAANTLAQGTADASLEGFGQGFTDSAGNIIDWTAEAAETIGEGLDAIPILGGLLGAAWSTATSPVAIAKDVAHGVPLDEVGLHALTRELKNIKTVAPYAQTVISFVPGIGPVASGAIGAGLALANGQPIDEAIIAGIKGALPGGPIAAAAFDAGVATIKGKPAAEIGISAVSGLAEGAGIHLPPAAQTALTAGLQVAKGVVEGKNVESAIVDEAISQLPPGTRDLANAARSLGQGTKLADILLEHGQQQVMDAAKAQVDQVAQSFGADPPRLMLQGVGKVGAKLAALPQPAIVSNVAKSSGAIAMKTASPYVKQLAAETKKVIDAKHLKTALMSAISVGTGAYLQGEMAKAAAGQINNLEKLGQYATATDPIAAAAAGIIAKPKLLGVGKVASKGSLDAPKIMLQGVGKAGSLMGAKSVGNVIVPTNFADDFEFGDQDWQELNGFAGDGFGADPPRLMLQGVGKVGAKLAAATAAPKPMLQGVGKVGAALDSARGFNIGQGLMQAQPTASSLQAIRSQLNPNEQSGFDSAVALRSGQASYTVPAGLSPEEQAAYLATRGAAETDSPDGVVANFLDDDSRQGVRQALADVHEEKGFFQKILEFLGLA